MSAPTRILIVEDEPAIREMIGMTLEEAGYTYTEADSADAAQTQIRDQCPDLILLDWMLPGCTGLELTHSLREDPVVKDIPIIILTARSEENSKVSGLNAGADDYMTKPFSPRELVARIAALLRRANTKAPSTSMEIAGLRLDSATRRVSADGQLIDLGPTEFRLLKFLMTHPETVHSRTRLIQSIWDKSIHVEERTIDVHIRHLRKALEPFSLERLIQTVRSAGYRFSSQ